MKIDELKKVVEAAKNNPDFDMNNWGECLVGSYLQNTYHDDEVLKLTKFWAKPCLSEKRYEAAGVYFDISKDEAISLFGMRDSYNDIYDEENSESYDPSKDARMMVREMAVERLEEFIWEAENA